MVALQVRLSVASLCRARTNMCLMTLSCGTSLSNLLLALLFSRFGGSYSTGERGTTRRLINRGVENITRVLFWLQH